MKKADNAPYIIHSISELHRLFALPKPDHPLVSVIDFSLLSYKHSDVWKHFVNEFYCVVIKKGVNGKMKYGQQDYDFDEGMMTFTQPGQVFSVTNTNDSAVQGFMLVFKPDFVRNYPLAQAIKNYGFFSYSLTEALHLSEKEDVIITNILQNLAQEIKSNIDNFSQDVIISHIELLLNYANRFYNRQFIVRKAANNDVLIKLEKILADYFKGEELQHSGLPTVKYISEQLHLSPNYLSDMLRTLTGQNTQQHIHEKLIEKAKEILSTSSLSVSEIAYQLGFEYPQSFSKLFKKKTNVTPLEFRLLYN